MSYRFVTYNIHKAIGTDGEYRPDRIAEVLSELQADVIAMQEVDQFAPRSRSDDLGKLLAAELGMHYNLGLNVRLKEGAYGNATLSRHPILDSRNINLTWGIKKRRGCLVSRIQTPDGEIAVFNFHLGLAAFERMWQVKKMLRSPSLRSLSQYPVILLGDGNDRKQKLNPVFEEAGFPDTCTKNRGHHTWPSYAPIMRLDKVFASSHWEVERHEVVRTGSTRVASDHLPLSVSLKLLQSDDAS